MRSPHATARMHARNYPRRAPRSEWNDGVSHQGAGSGGADRCLGPGQRAERRRRRADQRCGGAGRQRRFCARSRPGSGRGEGAAAQGLRDGGRPVARRALGDGGDDRRKAGLRPGGRPQPRARPGSRAWRAGGAGAGGAAAGQRAPARREERDRHRLGQGRSRQVDDSREPRHGHGRPERPGRPARLRHLRPLDPAHAQSERPAGVGGGAHAAPHGQLRNQVHVDRVPRRRGHGHDLAWPDGHAGARADDARRRLGRA